MKIRLINEQDWEKVYELDKSLVRVGSQISCDIQIKAKNIQPLHLQITRTGTHDIRFIMRTFADNVQIDRGDQSFVCQQLAPQLLMDGDKISFGSYRMIINMEDEHTRIRKSAHIAAEMFLQKRELDIDSPINGALKLKNLGTDDACQFSMRISGIPDDCLKSSPLPYLYPGGEGTVGFMITHLQTRPEPGFHTVSITVSAPEEYFGELLEFNQDIYVAPVFDNEIILEDDSVLIGKMDQADKKAEMQTEEEKPQTVPDIVSEPVRMDLRQAAFEEQPVVIDRSAAVVYSKDSQQGSFDDVEEEPVTKRAERKKKEKVVVIHRDAEEEALAFDGVASDGEQTASGPQDEKEQGLSDEMPRKAEKMPAAENDAEQKKDAAGKSEAAKVKKTKQRSSDTNDGSAGKKTGTVKKSQTAEKTEKPAGPAVIKPASEADETVPEKAEAPAEPAVSKPAAQEAVTAPEMAEVPAGTQDHIDVPAEPEKAEPNKETTAEAADTVAVPAEAVLPSEVTENGEGSSADEAAPAVSDNVSEPEESGIDGSQYDDDEWRKTMMTLETKEGSAEEREETADAEEQKPAEETQDQLPGDIPVIHGSGSFGFDDGASEIPPASDKKEEVVVMKGGKFDE